MNVHMVGLDYGSLDYLNCRELFKKAPLC